MVNPGRKLKKIVLIAGITGAVYGGFRYLLPLVVPFLCAYGAALWLRPSVRYLEKRLSLRIYGKRVHLPIAVIGAAEVSLLLAAIAGILYVVGSRIWIQLDQLKELIPSGLYWLDETLTGMCRRLEDVLGVRRNVFVSVAREMVRELGSAIKSASMPFIMNNSLMMLKWVVESLIFLVIVCIATILFLQEMDEIRERKNRSMFHREFLLIGKRLAAVGSAWLKAEILIAVITSGLCTAGLFILGNPYALVLGIGIGLLDALPLFGAGIVLIPWGVIMFLQKQWMYGMVLIGLYVMCYILRQFLEAKLMGTQVGLSPLETLVSMYVGLQLFGLAGVFLGPIGLLMIEDLVALYWNCH